MRRYEELEEFLENMVRTLKKAERVRTGNTNDSWAIYRHYMREHALQREKLKMMAEDPEWATPFMKLKLQGLDWMDAV